MKAVLACVFMLGCVVDDATSTDGVDDPEEARPDEAAEASEQVEDAGRIAINSLDQNRLALTRLSLGGLSISGVGGRHLVGNALLATTALTPGGREVLRYTIGCALDADTTITVASVIGAPHTFHGGVGLAPAWATRALTQAERTQLSACLIARVNHFGVEVKLSLRGPSLATTHAERAAFGVEEGAFWGDVFTGVLPMQLRACTGRDLAEAPTFGTLPLRVCARHGSPCGFEVVGRCASACSVTDGAYAGCPRGGARPISVWLEGARRR